MSTIGEVYKKAFEKGKEVGITPNEIRLLMMKCENLSAEIDVIVHKEREMKNEAVFDGYFEQLLKGEPIEYITHQSHFLNQSFYVDERVLIPRGETEELVALLTERIGDYYDPRNFLCCADIGTGSGVIAISIKRFFPNWMVYGSDISKDALEVAKKNKDDSYSNITLYEGDGLTPYIDQKMFLDVIISNPPYILNKEDAQESVRDYEPSSALWLDKDNSLYEKIFRDAHLVKRGGLLMLFEISPDLVSYLEDLMKKYLKDYEYEFIKDLNGFERFLLVNYN